jgi:glycosyltransferase involved in cell wall biosynthesis
MMTPPTISVVIPFYRARYLRDAIESVLKQTFEDYEIIVIDDGSPDRPDVEGWLRSDRHRFQYLRQENKGPAAARNTGIRAAQGRFVAFLDSDDMWEPTYLEEQLGAIHKGQGFDLIHCNALMIGQPESARPALMQSTPPRDLATCTSLLRDDVTVYLSSVVARREALLEAGLFDERFVHGEDFDLWMRLLKNGAHMAFQPRVLLNRRLHADSLSADALIHSDKALLVLEKFRDRQDLTAAERSATERRIQSLRAEVELERAKRALASGDFGLASRSFRDANGFYRSWKLNLLGWLVRCWPSMIARTYNFRERRRMERSPLGK